MKSKGRRVRAIPWVLTGCRAPHWLGWSVVVFLFYHIRKLGFSAKVSQLVSDSPHFKVLSDFEAQVLYNETASPTYSHQLKEDSNSQNFPPETKRDKPQGGTVDIRCHKQNYLFWGFMSPSLENCRSQGLHIRWLLLQTHPCTSVVHNSKPLFLTPGSEDQKDLMASPRFSFWGASSGSSRWPGMFFRWGQKPQRVWKASVSLYLLTLRAGPTQQPTLEWR